MIIISPPSPLFANTLTIYVRFSYSPGLAHFPPSQTINIPASGPLWHPPELIPAPSPDGLVIMEERAIGVL